jgi:hypothetical protein
MPFNLAVLAGVVGPVISAAGQTIKSTSVVPEVLLLLWWGGSLLALARRARLTRASESVR